MEPADGDQIDGPAEQIGEVIGELLDVPAQTPARLQGVQDVDVAVGGRGTAYLRAEELKFSDTVPVADRGQACPIDLYSCNGPHRASVVAGAARRGPAMWS